MATVLVTGANRGLGLEFCRQYAADGWRVLACCRHPDTAVGLAELPGVSVHALDVSDFKRIDNLALALRDTPIDVFINNAGVYGDSLGHAFGHLDYEAWTQALKINSQAPVKMAEAFLPTLNARKKSCSSRSRARWAALPTTAAAAALCTVPARRL